MQDGFEWIDCNNDSQSVFSFIRKGKSENDYLLIICNFTGVHYPEFKIGVPAQVEFREIFNSDHQDFGGAGFVNKKTFMALEEPFHGKPLFS